MFIKALKWKRSKCLLSVECIINCGVFMWYCSENKIYSYMQQYGWAERQWWAKYSGYKRIPAVWFHLGKVKRTAKIKQCNIYICGTTMKSDSRQWATFIGEGEDVIGRGAHRKLLRFWQYFLSISCVFCLGVCILKMNILWRICMFYFHQYIFYNQNIIRKL